MSDKEEIETKCVLIEERLSFIMKKMQDAKVAQYFIMKAYDGQLEDIRKDYDDFIHQAIIYNAAHTEQIEITKRSEKFFDSLATCKAKFMCLEEEYHDKKKANATASSNPTSSTSNKSQFKLPQLTIPVFHGKVSEWNHFHNLFDTLVHNNSAVPTMQKFTYLKSLVKGEALTCIQQVPFEESQYNTAYQLLIDRFDCPRRRASYYFSLVKQYKDSGKILNCQKFLQTHQAAYHGLKGLNIPDLFDFMFFQLMYCNLNEYMKKQFDIKNTNQIPTSKNLFDFLIVYAKNEELKCDSVLQGKKDSNDVKDNQSNTPNKVVPKVFVAGIRKCPLCKQDWHPIADCNSFLEVNPTDRLTIIKKLKLCIVCFNDKHEGGVPDCNDSGCQISGCGGRHHSLLHRENKTHHKRNKLECHLSTMLSSIGHNNDSNNLTALSCQSGYYEKLLGTLQGFVKDRYGVRYNVRVLGDNCSQTILITSESVNRLSLSVQPCVTEVRGVGNKITACKGQVSFKLFSYVRPDYFISLKADIVDNISDSLPQNKLPNTVRQRFSHLTLADENFDKPGKIDILVSVDIFYDIICNEGEFLIKGEPSALNTYFGWVICGRILVDQFKPSNNIPVLYTISPSLEETLIKFWQTEQVAENAILDSYDDICEQIFVKTVRRSSDGRYIVRLPFNPFACGMSSNRTIAKSNFYSLERRLNKDPDLKETYCKIIDDYMRVGHMVKAHQPQAYVLPHHPVIKPSSTTPVRVVFNASANDDINVSLNDRLLAGQKLQRDLTLILISFRLHQVVFTCDIRQMYRQIWVHEEDRQFQHIFWRTNPSEPLQEYELTTVTWGTKPAPFLAQRVLRQLVADEGSKFPLAVHTVTHRSYIDDFFSGGYSTPAVLRLQKELISLLRKGGFELRKWASNDPAILETVPNDHRMSPLSFDGDIEGVKVLGLLWDSRNDIFYYRVETFTGPMTKRNILSFAAKTFDPLGFLAPVVFFMKHFLQKLWLNNLDWDTSLDGPLSQEWSTFMKCFLNLQDLRIPRQVMSTFCMLQIVGFSDASNKGYGAVIYLRCEINERVQCKILMSKTKVAPIKILKQLSKEQTLTDESTIPKLELCGTVLLARLYDHVMQSEVYSRITQGFLFSDSQIVLNWIQKPPNKLTTYVANRVVQVVELTKQCTWFYVSSKDNPADLASRGCTADVLVHHPLWWDGPAFIQTPMSDRKSGIIKIDEAQLPEFKAVSYAMIATLDEVTELAAFYEMFRRFSSYVKLQRTLAYVKLFISKVRARIGINGVSLQIKKLQTDKKLCVPLTVSDLKDAEILIMKIAQAKWFANDIAALSNDKECSQKLLNLSPFIDQDGVMRVGGRLKQGNIPMSQKHPIVLAKQCYISKLLCQYYHKKYLHCGPKALQAFLSLKYWIISVRMIARSIFRSCVPCIRFNRKPNTPFMGDLPPNRINAEHAFTYVGIDFAGPFQFKDTNLRKARIFKGYLCLFVCMTYKAVHLEFTSDMTAIAFLAAFDRFTARRGLPAEAHSDNGTNFVGGYNDLHEYAKFLIDNADTILSELASRNVKWNFNPPNFGGLWEAAVKQAKRLLYNVINRETLTVEEAFTLFSRVEMILNSRPLSFLSSDPNEDFYLSPGHFLIGRQLIAPPEIPLTKEDGLKCRWQKLKVLGQYFWKRFSREYLNTILQRTKWVRKSIQPVLNQIVILRDVNTHPLTWPLGRIVRLHAGPDGIIRVVTVKTKCQSGTLVRPINKLILIPIDSTDSLN